MDRYREHTLFYVYQRPLKRTSWKSVKVTALNLGDSFTEANEFSKRIAAAEHQRGSCNIGQKDQKLEVR
jgi:hypothetical protein